MSRGEIFAFIAAEKTAYGVRRLCRVLGVSNAAFHDLVPRGGGPIEAELAEGYAIDVLHTAWAEHRRTYGARRLTAEIRDRGHDWVRERVARLMAVGGVEGVNRRRRGKETTRQAAGHAPAPDLVDLRTGDPGHQSGTEAAPTPPLSRTEGYQSVEKWSRWQDRS